AADREPGHAGSGRSLRLRAARGARGGPHVRDLQLVRLRRPERDAALPARRRPMTRPGVAITGVGVVSAAVTGDSAALGAFLAAPAAPAGEALGARSEEHTSELQSRSDIVCRLLLEKKKNTRRS